MAKETFTTYDSADYLKTDEDIALYLQAAAEEAGHDPAFITHALGVAARARNMSQIARDSGITREGLYKALSEGGNPSFATVVNVARALGLGVGFTPISAAPKAIKKRGAKASPEQSRKKTRVLASKLA